MKIERRSVTIAALLTLALGVWIGSRLANKAPLVVRNESGQALVELTVKICGQILRFENVENGASVESGFYVRGDDHFVAKGVLKDGTRVSLNAGYVTNGIFNQAALITINGAGSLKLEQGVGTGSQRDTFR
jgi:hypothetical protein